MLKKIIEWLSAKPKVIEDTVESAKIEKMLHNKKSCGCGRSSVGHCVGLHKLTTEEWVAHPENPDKVSVKIEDVVVTEVSMMTVSPKILAEDIAGLNKTQLLDKAKELNVKVNTRMTKDEIIKKLIKA